MNRTILSLIVAAAASQALAIGPIDGISNPDSVTVFSGDMVSMDSFVTNGADTVSIQVLDADGAVHFSTSVTPSADGSISFAWFPLFDGTFRIEAASYSNGEYLATETLSFVSSVRPDAAGFVTGGGWFAQDSGRNTFGFVAQVMRGGAVRGNMEFQDHAGDNNWKSSSLDWVYAENETDAFFSGWATKNQQDLYRFFAEVHDFAEPGRQDSFQLWVYDPLTGDLQFSYAGLLDGGNIQIHRR